MGLAVRVDVTMLGSSVQVGAVVRERFGSLKADGGRPGGIQRMMVLVGVTVWKRR